MAEKVLEKQCGNNCASECGDGNFVTRRDHSGHQAAQKARDYSGDQATQREFRKDRMDSDNCRPHSNSNGDTTN
jgi:hypothetical protein